MKKISIGTKMVIYNTTYIVNQYEDEKGKYYVVEGEYGGNLNGIHRTMNELIEELEKSIGRRAIRSAFFKK